MDLQALAHSCLKPPPNNPGPARPWPMTAHPSAQRVEAAPSVHGVGGVKEGALDDIGEGAWTTSGRGSWTASEERQPWPAMASGKRQPC
jgi:hypothetical protein